MSWVGAGSASVADLSGVAVTLYNVYSMTDAGTIQQPDGYTAEAVTVAVGDTVGFGDEGYVKDKFLGDVLDVQDDPHNVASHDAVGLCFAEVREGYNPNAGGKTYRGWDSTAHEYVTWSGDTVPLGVEPLSIVDITGFRGIV